MDPSCTLPLRGSAAFLRCSIFEMLSEAEISVECVLD